MPILGTLYSESDANWRFKNIRRQVFYFYPNGAAPLTGLLSLMSEEDSDDPEFSWWEKRLSSQSSLTAAAGPVFLAAGGGGVADPFTWTADTEYQIVVLTDAANTFRVWHEVKVPVTCTAGVKDIKGIVTAIVDATHIKVRATNTIAGVTSGAGDNESKEVLIIGTAVAQGQTTAATTEIYNLPINPDNYCQIFRTPFTFAGTVLKMGLKFDTTGPYKDKAKEHSVYHMTEMEKAFIFGAKRKFTSSSVPTFTCDGVLGFLDAWEAADSIYRGGAGAPAVTLDTDDNKRIITNSTGKLSEKQYDGYLERCFRVTNNRAFEKLVLCGSGFLNVINQLYKSKGCLNASLPMTETYGMNVTQHVTPFGTLYYKSHPLFSANSTLRFNALFCDVQNMKYRYIQGRDTELLKNRQAPDSDTRKDEWLTEAGLELRFPESFMYLQNVTDYLA